jgi:hypothetical protein
MNPLEIDSVIPLQDSGRVIVFSTITNSGTVAGITPCVATADPITQIFRPVTYRQITFEIKNVTDDLSHIAELPDEWLKLSESSFEFWDNASDSKYDRL